MSQGNGLLRTRSKDGHARVTFVELFFDLVFVFAITQLSHGLLEHLTPEGAMQTLLLLFAVWWVWIYTSWATNWLDPETTPVRLLLFAMMLAGIVLSASLPKAFEDRGLWFAGAYVSMQVGRSLFTLWALYGHNPANFKNFQRIVAWFLFSAIFWIAGGFVEGHARFTCWALAMLTEFLGPALYFWTPGLGRSHTADWDIAGGHIAERCGLFVILALGESILINGAAFSELTWDAATLAAFACGLIGSIAMWWIYFNIGAERATHLIEHVTDPGRIARYAYTYLHVVIVAGLIVGAAGDEIALQHPHGETSLAAALVLTGGPMLFLAGCLLFKWATAGWPPLSHIGGIAFLILLFLGGRPLSPLAMAAATALILCIVAVWETVSLGQKYREHQTP
jgi:low temperature requirement protein LtrA